MQLRGHNALLIFDEIQCGVGRPGVPFAYKLFDPVVMPDIAVAAKPLGCGLPIGFVAANERAASAIAKGMHGTTFGGGALVCRVALEFFDILEELLPNIIHVGGYFRMQLMELARHYSFIKEVRGFGLMVGVELEFPGKQIVLDCMDNGLLINCTHGTVLRCLPPYILTEQDVDRAIKVLKGVFKKTLPGRDMAPVSKLVDVANLLAVPSDRPSGSVESSPSPSPRLRRLAPPSPYSSVRRTAPTLRLNCSSTAAPRPKVNWVLPPPVSKTTTFPSASPSPAFAAR